MPFVNVRTVKGFLSIEEKEQLQKRITDLMVEFEGQGDPKFRPFVWVLIEEYEAADWQLGGVHPVPELRDRLLADGNVTGS